jgi:hypothetical protein
MKGFFAIFSSIREQKAFESEICEKVKEVVGGERS